MIFTLLLLDLCPWLVTVCRLRVSITGDLQCRLYVILFPSGLSMSGVWRCGPAAKLSTTTLFQYPQRTGGSAHVAVHPLGFHFAKRMEIPAASRLDNATLQIGLDSEVDALSPSARPAGLACTYVI